MAAIPENLMPYALAVLLGAGGGTGVSQFQAYDHDPIEEKLDSIEIQLHFMARDRAQRSVDYWEDIMREEGTSIEDMSAEQRRLYRTAIEAVATQNAILRDLGGAT
jgi:hypothetical protein